MRDWKETPNLLRIFSCLVIVYRTGNRGPEEQDFHNLLGTPNYFPRLPGFPLVSSPPSLERSWIGFSGFRQRDDVIRRAIIAGDAEQSQ